MKNYYFNSYLEILDENTINDCEEVWYTVVNDVKKFKTFSDRINMIDYGVTSTGIYLHNLESEEWRELNQCIKSPLYNILIKYLNKTKDDTKKNSTMNSKEKTFNYSIEFKNGDFISKENCNKSFDEIINSVKDLYNSAVFGGNVKKITIEMN